MVINNHNAFSSGTAKDVKKTINDIVVYQNVEEAVQVLNVISVNLDKVQRNGATLFKSVLAWKFILKNYRDLGSEGREWLAAAESRYNKSVNPVFYVAF